MTREEQIEKQAQIDKCCYVDNNYYAFKRGVDWANKHPKDGLVSIDKACEWLKKNAITRTDPCYNFLNDFRKAMEE